MREIEVAIATDFAGESGKLEDIEQMLKKVAEAGFTHIHWCHEWDGDYLYSQYEMKQIREWMDKYGLKAKSLHASKGSRRYTGVMKGHYRKDYTSGWEYNRRAGVELIKNRVDLASCLGASEIVLHLYIPYISFREDEKNRAEFYSNVKKSMDELQPYCLEKGVKICLENLFDQPEEDMLEQWDWVMSEYSAEFLGFCLDAGHGYMLWREKLEELIRKYGERIFSIHLHDNYGACDMHMLPGDGTIPWKAVMKALAQSAYQLPLVLEVSCGREDVDNFLKRAFESGKWLTKMFMEG